MRFDWHSFLHVVEFSRYGCALRPESLLFSGQTDKHSGAHTEGQFRVSNTGFEVIRGSA